MLYSLMPLGGGGEGISPPPPPYETPVLPANNYHLKVGVAEQVLGGLPHGY